MISPEIFYLHLEGAQRGPYTIPQIDHLLNSGLIAQETLYWREGLDQWQPVTDLVKLRRKANSWVKPLFVIAMVLVVASVAQFFGSIALVGWRETNQHDYTELGAYWRARGAVRSSALPPGALVQFRDFDAAQVELQPPRSATVILHGEVTLLSNEVRAAAWSVPMTFDPEAREWTGEPASDIAP